VGGGGGKVGGRRKGEVGGGVGAGGMGVVGESEGGSGHAAVKRSSENTLFCESGVWFQVRP